MGIRDRLADPPAALRAGLALFVLAWLFGPYALRAAFPVWIPFLIALGLELQFFASGALRGGRETPDRAPGPLDRELYGYGGGAGELLLVRVDGDEVWVPYAGEDEEELAALVEAELERRDEPAPDDVEPEPRRVGPALRRLATGVAVIAGLAAVVWLVDERSAWERLDGDTRVEATQRFSAEASRVAGKEVRIRCDESGDYVGAVRHADGVAEVGGEVAYLTPQRCLDLYRLAFRGEVRDSQTGRAISVLAHEAFHLRGVADEGTTECYALQAGVEVGRRLGLSEGTARRLMRQQLAENALHGGRSAEYLLPAGCRDGGPLDLAPERSVWP